MFLQGLGDIKSEIERVQVSHQALQPQRYLMASSVVRIEEDILTSLKKGKILDFKLLIENLSGMATLSLLKEMQSQVWLFLHKAIFSHYAPIIQAPDKSVHWKTFFFISHSKHVLWVLKRTASMRQFF